jgi:hypothetical protein
LGGTISDCIDLKGCRKLLNTIHPQLMIFFKEEKQIPDEDHAVISWDAGYHAQKKIFVPNYFHYLFRFFSFSG